MVTRKTGTTGFEDPGLRLRRLLPAGVVLYQIAANKQLGKTVNWAGLESLQSMKDICYKLAVDDEYRTTTDDRFNDLLRARKIVYSQLAMGEANLGLELLYKQLLLKLDCAIEHYNDSWHKKLYPLLEDANIYPRKKK